MNPPVPPYPPAGLISGQPEYRWGDLIQPNTNLPPYFRKSPVVDPRANNLYHKIPAAQTMVNVMSRTSPQTWVQPTRGMKLPE